VPTKQRINVVNNQILLVGTRLLRDGHLPPKEKVERVGQMKCKKATATQTESMHGTTSSPIQKERVEREV
jgi:hypothetical protein